MTYKLSIMPELDAGKIVLLTDSRATISANQQAGPPVPSHSLEYWAKNFVIGKDPEKPGSKDFLMAGSGSLSLVYHGRQKLIENGPFYDIDQLSKILLEHISGTRVKDKDKEIPSFILAGPHGRGMVIRHIDDTLYEHGFQDSTVSAQGGSGFAYVHSLVREHMANGWKPSVETAGSAATTAAILIQKLAKYDPRVNGKIQLTAVQYDGHKTTAGIMYPAFLSLNATGKANEEFASQYMRIMSGLDDLGTYHEKGIRGLLVKSGVFNQSEAMKRPILEEDIDDLFARTSVKQRSFYDKFMATLKFISETQEAKQRGERINAYHLGLAESLIEIGIGSMLSKNPDIFFETYKKYGFLPENTLRIVDPDWDKRGQATQP